MFPLPSLQIFLCWFDAKAVTNDVSYIYEQLCKYNFGISLNAVFIYSAIVSR
ncbi:hypothetical protein D3C76_1833460 [compost metagenome]